MSIAWPEYLLPPPVFPLVITTEQPLAVYDLRTRMHRRRSGRRYARLRATFMLREQEWGAWQQFWADEVAYGVLPVRLPASWLGREVTARIAPDWRVRTRGTAYALELVFEEV